MAKERLSKLQKDILIYLYRIKGSKSYSHESDYDDVKFGVKRIYNFEKDRAEFGPIFSQSIRNMAKKGYVELQYKYETSDLKFYHRKKCKRIPPSDNTPCSDCPYIKTYDHFEYSEEGGCYAYRNFGQRGRGAEWWPEDEKKGLRIHSIRITRDGEKLLFQKVLTPDVIKKEKEFMKFYTNQMGWRFDELTEEEKRETLEERLEERAEEIILKLKKS